MTEERLAEIEAREQAATGGPWQHRPHGHYDDWGLIRAADGMPVASANLLARHPEAHPRPDPRTGRVPEPEEIQRNGQFLAHARQDVPDLVEEVRRLRAELAARG